MVAAVQPSVEQFADEASKWLSAHAQPRGDEAATHKSGGESFSVAVFHALGTEQEQHLLDELVSWNQLKAEVGYHAITWPSEYGGLGLSKEHARAYARLELAFSVPVRHETFSVTTGLVAPTVERFGTEEQKQRFVTTFLRADQLCCQLFSEPGAGSDLAGVGCRAVPDGDEWVLQGQKIWSSGAQYSQWGLLLARTDPDVPKHRGITAFLVPVRAPGVEIRPIKQMSGGASFNEVFFDGARVPDSLRLGAVGDGWNVALTTLGFERESSGSGGGSRRPGGSFQELLVSARALGRTGDPIVRDRLAQVYIRTRVQEMIGLRAEAGRQMGAPPGPEGSIGKLVWTDNLEFVSEVASLVVGPALLADTGQWATYEWTEHVLGAPGYRIAGGSDEIQRNIVGERVLGLPGEPRVDRNQAWKDVAR